MTAFSSTTPRIPIASTRLAELLGRAEGIGHEGDPGGDHQDDSEHVGELRPELGQHRPPAWRRQLVGTDLRPPRRRLIRRKPPARAPEPGQNLMSLQRRHRRRRHQML
jgi:hypothetical protein